MNAKFAIALGLSLLTIACSNDTEITLDALIERHTAARGGAETLESIQSVSVELEITEPGFTVHGEYVASKEGYMRIDIYAGTERVFTEALGPDGGWQLFQGETIAVDLSPGGEEALRRGLIGNLYALHELAALGYELEFIGREWRGEEWFWVIDLIAPDQFVKRLFFDEGTYVLVRETEMSALHPDIDSTEVQHETVMSEFVVFDGIPYATTSNKLNMQTGEVVQEESIINVSINPHIDMSLFDRPR